MISLLHADHSAHGGALHFLTERLGEFGRFVDEVLWHGFIDTLKIVLFLFLTYLLMEYIEHKASDKLRSTMTSAGRFGPAIGGAFGVVPQCGFSAVAANLYTGRVITLGTLVAVFLSTSDEMIPVMIAGNIEIKTVLLIMVYKMAVGILVGFAIDTAMRFIGVEKREIDIDAMCDSDGCHCEKGIVRSAIHHTVKVSLFIFAVTLLINALVFFIGYDALSAASSYAPVLSHILCAVVGLVPNCASSVALTQLAISGVISSGAMISGLLSGAGVGVLVLLRMNKRPRENAIILAILVVTGIAFGLLSDLIGIRI